MMVLCIIVAAFMTGQRVSNWGTVYLIIIEYLYLITIRQFAQSLAHRLG